MEVLGLMAVVAAQAADLPEAIHVIDLDVAQPTDMGLQPLKEMVGAADVLGVGERIHLSGGLERARAAVAAYAIEELGFDALALEISWVEARVIDAGLQRCAQGARPPAVPFDDPLWDGIQPLLARICAWNSSNPPVHVFGFDVQDAWNHRAILEAEQRDEALRQCHGAPFEGVQEMRAWGRANGFPPPTRAAHRTCLRQIRRRHAQETDPQALLALDSLKANQHRAWALFTQEDVSEAYRLREEAMFDVFLAERARVGAARVVMLAHDEHVARTSEEYDPIGGMLHAEPGLAYGNLSVSGYRVQTRLGERFDVPLPEEGSPEARWHDLGQPTLLIDHQEQAAGRHDGTIFVDQALRD